MPTARILLWGEGAFIQLDRFAIWSDDTTITWEKFWLTKVLYVAKWFANVHVADFSSLRHWNSTALDIFNPCGIAQEIV